MSYHLLCQQYNKYLKKNNRIGKKNIKKSKENDKKDRNLVFHLNVKAFVRLIEHNFSRRNYYKNIYIIYI